MDQPLVTLNVLWTPLAVCRLGAGSSVPERAWDGAFCSMVREEGALNLICDEAALPADFIGAERDFRAVRIESMGEMSAAEARATLTRCLRAAGVRSMLVDEDVLLVKELSLHDAVVALERAGFAVEV